jgi:hypothetical protein
MAIVAPQRSTRRAAEQAAERLFRGVVAASSAVDVSATSGEESGDADQQG